MEIFFIVCFFSLWNDREVIPGRTRAIEPNYGREKGRTYFVRTGVDRRLNHNHSCKILLMYDYWTSNPRSPAGMRDRLGSVISN